MTVKISAISSLEIDPPSSISYSLKSFRANFLSDRGFKLKTMVDFERLHQCWRWMLETVYIDNFEMLVTNSLEEKRTPSLSHQHHCSHLDISNRQPLSFTGRFHFLICLSHFFSFLIRFKLLLLNILITAFPLV